MIDSDFSSDEEGENSFDDGIDPVQYMKHGKERHEDILAKRKLGEATKKVGENIEKKKTTRESKELKDLNEKKA